MLYGSDERIALKSSVRWVEGEPMAIGSGGRV